MPLDLLSVTTPGFGAMGLSHSMGTSLTLAQAEPLLLRALELGCTFWDTAVLYGAGVNESLLGDFIRKNNVRDKVFSARASRSTISMCWFAHVVASKCGVLCLAGEPRKVDNSPAHIADYIEGTIERLGFAPDMYYLHRIDPNIPLEESIPALDALKKAGKTKYIGLSECSAQTLRRACQS
jgi:aryl-alcohol dehydrogenase-like predicted oxidoreductase